MAKPVTLDDRIDQLYAGPADEFVARRDELVKELKAAKDKEGAATVKALRKPTAAAWAVNQLAHTAPRDLSELLDVGDALRDAHDALADGRGDAGIRSATTKRRRLVSELTDRAVSLLGAGGEAQRDAISNTLDAAVADPDAGISVQEGRLTKELAAPSGFGAGLVFSAPPAEPRESAARREERRAARVAARSRGSVETAGRADTEVLARRDAEGKRRAAAERQARIEAAAAECERCASEAQQAARDAAMARQEVGRLQDELVIANAKAKAADDKARLAQWAAATAQQSLRDVEQPSP